MARITEMVDDTDAPAVGDLGLHLQYMCMSRLPISHAMSREPDKPPPALEKYLESLEESVSIMSYA